MNGVIAAMVLATSVGFTPGEDAWTTDYKSALNAARKTDKPLLVVLHKPSDPQQRLDHAEGQPGPEGQALLANYHLCKIDVSTKYGQSVAKVFGAKEFPYTVVSNKSASKIVLRRVGTFANGTWATTLADYRHGRAPVSAKSASVTRRETSPRQERVAVQPSQSRPSLLQSPFINTFDPATCAT